MRAAHIIESTDTPFDEMVKDLPVAELFALAGDLDSYRRKHESYPRIRALFYLYHLYRYHVVGKIVNICSTSPYHGHKLMAAGKWQEAIDVFLQCKNPSCAESGALCTALAGAYRRLAFVELQSQVRREVRSSQGNAFLFDGSLAQPHAVALLGRLICERTPVRADITHSAWSDIFFLAFDSPQTARVINLSVNLCLQGTGTPVPPVSAYVRLIEKPVIRLTALDLGATSDVKSLGELFDFQADYLGLLKASVIASGVVPPWLEVEAHERDLAAHLLSFTGRANLGLEVCTMVADIPKGSRLAVSTTLCASIIAALMRLSGQTEAQEGPLSEAEKRLVCSRSILAEWLGGSGGGWQDSGGVWPGLKQIVGVPRVDGRGGELLPRHIPIERSERVISRLKTSLIMFHGGMAQDVGPVLEMVTERYMLGTDRESRKEAVALYDEILKLLSFDNDDDEDVGDEFLRRLGELTTRNFFSLQKIIPSATNAFTEALIQAVREAIGEANYFGFLMLGGCSGGGMAFLVAPRVFSEAKKKIADVLLKTKRSMESYIPFAIDPVVYDFDVNLNGTMADTSLTLLPAAYYSLHAPSLLQVDRASWSHFTRVEMEYVSAAVQAGKRDYEALPRKLFNHFFPAPLARESAEAISAATARDAVARIFDPVLHARVKGDLIGGRVGLLKNRLPASTRIEDVREADVCDSRSLTSEDVALGQRAIDDGRVAVFCLAGGAGTRWTGGAGTVKALHPFVKLRGRFYSFLDLHLAKLPSKVPFIVSTSHLTNDAIHKWAINKFNLTLDSSPKPNVYVSPGKTVGIRMIPMVRDLHFMFEERRQDHGDEHKNRAQVQVEQALCRWAQQTGQGQDYEDLQNPWQAVHPCGHWYELPNLLRNGVLHRVLVEHPKLEWLLLHNCDTVGVSVDAGLLGHHIKTCQDNPHLVLTFEVIKRFAEDRGGGLARVDDHLRILEGLAFPREDDEFLLQYYSSNSSWVHVGRLLEVFHLRRDQLVDADAVDHAISVFAKRIPTYITIRDVRKKWGNGQIDTLPLSQHEALWGDMSKEVPCHFVCVPRERGQQLKDMSQLDPWMRDSSMKYVESLIRDFERIE